MAFKKIVIYGILFAIITIANAKHIGKRHLKRNEQFVGSSVLDEVPLIDG